MTASGVNSTGPLGFLTVVEDTNSGLFGGYLVLNRSGRPLEFHCTAPIRPNRAQEILYGPTLKPYLYGEQIGRTLLEKGKQTPAVVLTDCEPVLAMAEVVRIPIALVGAEETDCLVPAESSPKVAGGLKWRIDSAQKLEPNLRFFRVGGHCLALRRGAGPEEEDSAVRAIDAASVELDLREPFERIRAAIDEARRGGQ